MEAGRKLEPQRTTAFRAPVANRPSQSPEYPLITVLRCYGNGYVAQTLADEGGSLAPPEVQEGIERARGGGHLLDAGLREQLQPHFSHDLRDVRLHTDTRADALSRAIGARAFTVGSDIFFRGGECEPGTIEGRALLSHELTHVDQQDGATVGRRLEIGPPDDEFEREAQSVAGDLVRREQEATIRRQPEPREGERAESKEPASEQELSFPTALPTSAPSPPAPREQAPVRTLRRAPDGAVIRRQDPISTAIGAGSLLQETAAGFEIAKSAIAGLNQGDLHVSMPTSPIGVTWPAKPAELHLTAALNDAIIFSFREWNPIGGFDQVNIKLRCWVQYDGPQVSATFTFDPDGRRSRLMRDSTIEIGNPLSLETRVASPEWQRAGVHEYPVVHVPISVYVDRPWPLSNLSVNFFLVLSGMYGFGATAGGSPIERWTPAWT